jgi:antitoxin ParD1/3/4
VKQELEMSTGKRTISLPLEHAAFIDAKVASGDYASASEVVRAGLRALQERDAAVERWLREGVAPAYDAMRSDPSRGIDGETVFSEIRTRHAGRSKREARRAEE